MPEVLPVARTPAEAYAYLDLHPCASCGGVDFRPASSVVEADGDLAARYAGPCGQCGTQREYLFALPEHPVVRGPSDRAFGDGERSRLLDPGEWLFVADSYAAAAPFDPQATGDTTEARALLTTAVAALDEVLVFVDPRTGLVDEADLRSELGREVYAAEPGRLSADRLHVVRATYLDLLSDLTQRGGTTR